MRQHDPEVVLGIELAHRLDQSKGKILADAPVAILVGICQGTAGETATNAKMIQLGGMRAQAGLDIAQALAVG